MIAKRVFVFLATVSLLVSAAPSAGAETFEQLRGKSIVYSYVEELTLDNGNNKRVNSWGGKVYISGNGQIFLRQTFSSSFGNGGSEHSTESFDTVGDRNGTGQSKRTNFKWDGGGLTRSWRSGGVEATQSLTISGGRCSFAMERRGLNGAVAVRSQSCRIVQGNALTAN
jgi:hypothetical protein